MTQHQSPFTPVAKRASARTTDNYPLEEQETIEDQPWPGRLPSSARRYIGQKAPRTPLKTRVIPPVTATRRLPRSRFHPLVFVGIGLFIMIAGWLLFGTLSSWWTTQTNDWTYGRPRTYQTDDVVGHNGDSKDHPSHFVAFNLNRRVVVIEFPAEDASKAVQYLGPTLFGSGQELTPVTLSFEDRNGDGKPDLNIHIGDTIIVFLNDGTKFIPTHQQQ